MKKLTSQELASFNGGRARRIVDTKTPPTVGGTRSGGTGAVAGTSSGGAGTAGTGTAGIGVSGSAVGLRLTQINSLATAAKPVLNTSPGSSIPMTTGRISVNRFQLLSHG